MSMEGLSITEEELEEELIEGNYPEIDISEEGFDGLSQEEVLYVKAGARAALNLVTFSPSVPSTFRIECESCNGSSVYGYFTQSNNLRLECQKSSCGHSETIVL